MPARADLSAPQIWFAVGIQQRDGNGKQAIVKTYPTQRGPLAVTEN